jgi:hypothetical protein
MGRGERKQNAGKVARDHVWSLLNGEGRGWCARVWHRATLDSNVLANKVPARHTYAAGSGAGAGAAAASAGAPSCEDPVGAHICWRMGPLARQALGVCVLDGHAWAPRLPAAWPQCVVLGERFHLRRRWSSLPASPPAGEMPRSSTTGGGTGGGEEAGSRGGRAGVKPFLAPVFGSLLLSCPMHLVPRAVRLPSSFLSPVGSRSHRAPPCVAQADSAMVWA